MKIRHLLSLVTIISLSACGGDGNNGPGATVPPPPPAGGTGLVIDATNALAAVKVAYGANENSAGAGEVIGGPVIASSPAGGLSKPIVGNKIPDTLVRIMQKDPIEPIVTDCPGGGTETLTGDQAVQILISPGDTINTDYADCNNGFGEVLNGRIEMTITTFSIDLLTGLFLLEADALLIDYEVATGAETLLINGDSSVSIDTTGLPMILLSTSGNSLTAMSAVDTEILTNYSSSQTVDTSVFPEPYTQSTSGTVDSTQLDGVISFTTSVTFQGAGIAYPFAGELVVTGDGPATITLIAESETSVRIEFDSDGDGTPESTEFSTWDDFAL